jgi:hypothetical protein
VTISWLAGWANAPSSQPNNYTNPHLAITLPSVLVVARPPELLLIASHSASLFSHNHRRLFFLLGIVFSTIFMKTCPPFLGFRTFFNSFTNDVPFAKTQKRINFETFFDDSSTLHNFPFQKRCPRGVLSCLASSPA